MKKGKIKYRGFCLPVNLVEEIKKGICKSGRYTSITDFVREAIREKLEKLDRLNERKP